ncbi:MAG: RidA family protein [Gammaproteobacteria bacterium]|nr:RidA family protein [Gammaproteobacteria bacterium]
MVPEPRAPFSQIVLADTYAHLSGLVAADFPEGRAALGDVAGETRAVLNVIGRMLREIGLDTDRVVRMDVHLATLDDFNAMDAVYREFFDPGPYPARTTTESPRLFGGSRVEITCMARRRSFPSGIRGTADVNPRGRLASTPLEIGL